MKYLDDIDLNGNTFKNFRLEAFESLPNSENYTKSGCMVFLNPKKAVYIHNGEMWIKIASPNIISQVRYWCIYKIRKIHKWIINGKF